MPHQTVLKIDCNENNQNSSDEWKFHGNEGRVGTHIKNVTSFFYEISFKTIN